MFVNLSWKRDSGPIYRVESGQLLDLSLPTWEFLGQLVQELIGQHGCDGAGSLCPEA